MLQSIINLENVSYSYPGCNKRALENINLSIAQGEFLAVMGENGSGKTTFLRLLNGIIPHSFGGYLQGTVSIEGECTGKLTVPLLAVKVGMVLDDPEAQLFTASVRHEAAFGPENLMLPPQEIEERVRFSLSAVNLSGFEQRQPSTLSGGEKQRLAIASALAMKGKILVLDEPLSRLDPAGENQLMSVLKEIREKYKITIIMADHSSAMIMETADRICILKDGKLAALDTAKNIFSNHALLNENGIQPPGTTNVFSVFIKNVLSANQETKSQAIEITGLTYSYGKPQTACIENVNLSIADNDFAALIGHNGCGKTTLLKNITGLLRPCSGDIYIRGKSTRTLTIPAISKEVGFVMQNPDNQLFTGSVFEEVAFALKNTGLPKKEIQQRVDEALRIVGFSDKQAFPHSLNRAERTKIVFACVIAAGCKIIILDEVNIGQDYKGSLQIMDIAEELHSKGYTIIFVSHNMFLVNKYARRLIMMDKKGIVKDMRR